MRTFLILDIAALGISAEKVAEAKQQLHEEETAVATSNNIHTTNATERLGWKSVDVEDNFSINIDTPEAVLLETAKKESTEGYKRLQKELNLKSGEIVSPGNVARVWFETDILGCFMKFVNAKIQLTDNHISINNVINFIKVRC